MEKKLTGFLSYMHKKNRSIVLIASTNDEIGLSHDYGTPTILTKYSKIELGRIVNNVLEVCKTAPIIHSSEAVNLLEQATGLKGDKNINKLWKNIAITLNYSKEPWVVPAQTIPSGYTIDCWRNMIGNRKYPTFHLPLSATPEQIGEAVLKAFDAIEDIKD